MILNNVGYNHCHDADFLIDRPNGSGDCLLLILRTGAVFTLNGSDQYAPERSVMIYPAGMPQQYRCLPQQTFANDWMHFTFEADEEQRFLSRNIPYAKIIPVDYTEFYSFCIKAIADENSSDHPLRRDTVYLYFQLMCNKLSEQIHENEQTERGTRYEMMLTVRNQMYANPYWEWNVAWAAHQTRMSRSSFQHIYKEQFGVPFIQDLIRSRIEYAKMLLRTTNMSVQDVSQNAGYRNYEHFARQFRDQCGMTPGQFRQRG
ncbi:MAG: helix-turn-helix transcriptional regulator [Oscillospiraceae bacterium]|nr:helix-turn-helix transcriptional regulator [Oscillospiraceae bacterium]